MSTSLPCSQAVLQQARTIYGGLKMVLLRCAVRAQGGSVTPLYAKAAKTSMIVEFVLRAETLNSDQTFLPDQRALI